MRQRVGEGYLRNREAEVSGEAPGTVEPLIVGFCAVDAPGAFGHGGAFGTQGWIDPAKDLFVVLLIQRVGLKNADASKMRQDLQEIAVAAVGK